MKKFRVNLNLSQQLNISQLRSLYFSKYYEEADSEMIVTYSNFSKSDYNNNTQIMNSMLSYLNISNQVLMHQGTCLSIYYDLAEELVLKEYAYIENNQILLYSDSEFINKAVYDFVLRKKHKINIEQINAISNMVLINKDGSPSVAFANVVDDYVNDVHYVYSDDYYFMNTIQEIILRCVLEYPIVTYGHFQRFIYGNEILQLGDKSLAATEFINSTSSEDKKGLKDYLLISGWRCHVLIDGQVPKYSEMKEYSRLGEFERKNMFLSTALVDSYRKKYKGANAKLIY